MPVMHGIEWLDEQLAGARPAAGQRNAPLAAESL
jgi:hypothetical protein